jgi:hypothetical protein
VYAQDSPQFVFLASRIPGFAQTSTVQVRNRTNGAAMSLLKECVANNRLSAHCTQSRHSARLAGKPCPSTSLGVKQDRTWTGKLTFVEDFTLEHSLFGPHAPSIEIPGCF